MRKWRDESGQVLIVVGLSMTVLLGFVGFATDVGVLLHERRTLQSAADAAAIGAATEALWENTPTSVTSGMWTAATKDASLNGFTPGSSNGSTSTGGASLAIMITPNITIPGYNSSGYVQAVATQSTPTVFMNLFGFHAMNVTATAIASHKVTSNGCIYVLDSSSGTTPNDPNDTVDMNGNSLISSPNCGMTVNGTVNISGSASIDTKFTYASTTDVQPDPFNYLQVTANQPTVKSGTAMGGNCTLPANQTDTSLKYCLYDYNCSSTTNTCAITGSLQSNTLYYYDLPVNIAQGASVTGVEDTIYLTGSATSAAPYLDFMNGGLQITPPGVTSIPSSPPSTAPALTDCTRDTNPLCGIVIDAPSDGLSGGTYTCKAGHGNNAGNPGAIYFDFGSSTTYLYGIMYAPAMQLFVQDQGSSTYLYTNLVIGNICAQSAILNLVGFSGPNSPNVRTGLVY